MRELPEPYWKIIDAFTRDQVLAIQKQAYEDGLRDAADRIEQLERVLAQAREALYSCTPGDYSTGHVIHPSFDDDAVDQAIAAIDEALK